MLTTEVMQLTGWSENLVFTLLRRGYLPRKKIVIHKSRCLVFDKEEVKKLKDEMAKYITLNQFAELAGVSRVVIYHRLGVEGFPQQVKTETVPNYRRDARYFRRAEVEAYLKKHHLYNVPLAVRA